jgi:hypothetical protein
MPLQRPHRKRPQIRTPLHRPILHRQLNQPRPRHPIALRHRPRTQSPAPRPTIVIAGHPIRSRRPVNRSPAQVQPTSRTMPQLRHPPHQSAHPQTKISHRQPNPRLLRARLPRVPHLRDGIIVAKVGIRANARTALLHPTPNPHRRQTSHRQPKHIVLNSPIRHRLFQHLHHQLQPRQPQHIHRRRQRRPQNLEAIQPHQILPWTLRVVRPHVRRRLQRPAKPLARLHCMPRHALHLALVACKQAHQQVSLMERPRPQHNRFAMMRNLPSFSQDTTPKSTQKAVKPLRHLSLSNQSSYTLHYFRRHSLQWK